MTPNRMKWALFIVPALVIGGFETIRHTLLEQILPMEIGNWVTAFIDAAVIALISRKLFQHYAYTEKELSEERESRAVFEERERLARVLHDQIAQSIFYAGVQVEGAKKLADPLSDKTLQLKLDDVMLSLREMDDNVRQSIFNLRHTISEGSNLEERIRSYLRKYLSEKDIEWDLQFLQSPAALSPSEQVQLFGILQEAITNVMKHAQATKVFVSFDIMDDSHERWAFKIQDNGIGFDLTFPRGKRYGLGMIESRARDIGAGLRITSDGTGTTVCITHG